MKPGVFTNDFKKVLPLLLEIDKYINKSTAVIPDSLKEGPKREREAAQTKCKGDAEALIQELLQSYQSYPEAQRYIQQIVQYIRKKYGLIPKNTPPVINIPPHPANSAYAEHYNHARYQALYPYCQLAYLSEHNGIPEEHALKLSLLFDDASLSLKYINDNIKENTLAVHDACLFAMPDVKRCDFSEWKKLIKNNINDLQFREMLVKAPELENSLLQKVAAPGFNPRSDKNMRAIKAKKDVIKKKVTRYKSLKKKDATRMTAAEKIEEGELIKDISRLNIELFNMCAGLTLREADLYILNACNEHYLQSHDGAYKYMLDHGLTKQDHVKFFNLKRQDDDEQIPNIKINGEDIGYPGTYLMKVPVMDEMQAARAACFGKLTKCCQSLSGEAGESCVIHGLTSKYGGFYVLCEGDINHPSTDDKVLAQSWAWRSQSGALVLDSVETAYRFHAGMVADFYQHLAKNIVMTSDITKVSCGATSGISARVGTTSVVDTKEKFIDYDGHCDSVSQRVIIDMKNPFYLYEKDDECSQLTEQMMVESLGKDCGLVEDSYAQKLINWAWCYSSVELLEMVLAYAKYYHRDDEVRAILKALEEFIWHSQPPEQILSFVLENILHVDAKSASGETPLIYAVSNDRFDVMVELMQLGADINASDAKGQTALMAAAVRGNLSTASKLIAMGADVHAKNTTDETALILAVKRGHLEMVSLLLKQGANVDIKDGWSETALMTAIQKGLSPIALILMDAGADVNTKSHYNASPLMYAAMRGAIDLVSALIKKGAELHAKNSEGQTALDYAVDYGHFEVALMLAGLGIDPSIKNNNGSSALDRFKDEYIKMQQLQDKFKEYQSQKLQSTGRSVGRKDKNLPANTLVFSKTSASEKETASKAVETNKEIDSATRNNPGRGA